MPHFKKLTDKQHNEIVRQVKQLLHNCRDAMRNRYEGLRHQLIDDCECDEEPFAQSLRNRMHIVNTKCERFQISDGYYGEAFGVFRTLEILGYGALNLTENTTHNLRWWLRELEEEVLEEEGFHSGSHKCDYCVKTWGKDGAGRTRKDLVNAHV